MINNDIVILKQLRDRKIIENALRCTIGLCIIINRSQSHKLGTIHTEYVQSILNLIAVFINFLSALSI